MTEQPDPIPMVLYCPQCSRQHIDAPQPEKEWDNPPHRSHECQFCGLVWRPADVPTTGVQATQTHGSRDAAPVSARKWTLEPISSYTTDEQEAFRAIERIADTEVLPDSYDAKWVRNLCRSLYTLMAKRLARLSAPVPAREWIPVGERLPDGESVLARCNDGQHWVLSAGSHVPNEVTHWMPLPPPPAADK